MKVLAFMDTQVMSGPARQLCATGRALRETGIDFRVLAVLYGEATRSAFTDALSAHDIPILVARATGRINRAFLGSVAAALAEFAPDILQTHSYRPAFSAMLLRTRASAWRWIGFFHGHTNEDFKVRLYNVVDRLALARADRIVVVADSQRARFAGHRKLRQIANAVIPMAAAARAFDASSLQALSRPCIGYIGRLSHEKGVDLLLDAFAVLPSPRANASLVIVGDGPMRDVLAGQVARLGLEERVHFLGPVDDMKTLYEMLDLLALPSRSEGMPNVLLEASSFDLPMVATDVGDVGSILRGGAGTLVPAGDIAALASGMDHALAHGREPTAAVARKNVARRYSPQQRVSAHLALYDDLMQERR